MPNKQSNPLREKVTSPNLRKWLKRGPSRSYSPHAHHIQITIHTTCKATTSGHTRTPKSTRRMKASMMRMADMSPPKNTYKRWQVNSFPPLQPWSRSSVYSVMTSSYSSKTRKIRIRLAIRSSRRWRKMVIGRSKRAKINLWIKKRNSGSMNL